MNSHLFSSRDNGSSSLSALFGKYSVSVILAAGLMGGMLTPLQADDNTGRNTPLKQPRAPKQGETAAPTKAKTALPAEAPSEPLVEPGPVTPETLGKLPQLIRDKYLAEHFNIFFVKEADNNPFNATHLWVNPGATFVASDGMLHNFSNHSMGWGGRNTPQAHFWRLMRNHLQTVESRNLRAQFKPEVIKLACLNAEYLLKLMPLELRDAILADAAGLMFRKDGKEAYPGMREGVPLARAYDATIRSFSERDTMYVDSLGVTHIWQYLMKSHAEKWTYRINVVHVCIKLAGARQILNLFPEEYRNLKKNYKKVTGNAAPPLPRKKKGEKAPATPS